MSAMKIPALLVRRSNRIKKLKEEKYDSKDCEHTYAKKRIKIEKSYKIKDEPKLEIYSETVLIEPKEDSYQVELLQFPNADGHLEVDCDELDLERTLMGGQSFRWTKTSQIDSKEPIFTGVVLNHALQLWRISKGEIAFRTLNKESEDVKISETKLLLEDYFQLKYNLQDLYKEWSSRDSHLSSCCKQYKGFRILRQDPVENVFSFICATNNNIKRISLMVEKLCKRFGENLKSEEGCYHIFPTVNRLAEEDVFQCLRYELGFGYRAKFITETAKQVVKLSQEMHHESPRDYLLSLRKLPYKDTCKQLMQFQGIGRKVADCICLMSMDHLNSVPTDCHIHEIVCRHYMPNLRQEHKTLTETVHDKIGDFFNKLHGPLAGWSTSVLFIAELKHLKLDEKPKKSKNLKK